MAEGLPPGSATALVFVPRLNSLFLERDVDQAVATAVRKLGYNEPTSQQSQALQAFVRGKDVLVCLPTGTGKSLCYASLPYVFDMLRNKISGQHSFIAVVSPLSSLVEDNAKELKAAFVGQDQKNDSIKAHVVNARYSLVYISPESMLRVLKYREMFRSSVYQQNLICLAIDQAHCIDKWGEKFRQEFSKISEICGLIPPGTNVIALTAIATHVTRNIIIKSLEMTNCTVVLRVQNKKNIFYAVLPQPTSATVLDPIVEEVCTDGVKASRSLIFCRSYDDLLELYKITPLELNRRQALYTNAAPGTSKSSMRVCDKYDACTDVNVTKNIIQSFTDPEGTLRLVFATTAFGMGIDSPNIRRVIHWSPPNDLESYVQETGRAGRDNQLSTAILYYCKKDLKNVSDNMKKYCKNATACGRELLMESFYSEPTVTLQPQVSHQCCDICAHTCTCEGCEAAYDDEFQSPISMEDEDANLAINVQDNMLPTLLKIKLYVTLNHTGTKFVRRSQNPLLLCSLEWNYPQGYRIK